MFLVLYALACAAAAYGLGAGAVLGFFLGLGMHGAARSRTVHGVSACGAACLVMLSRLPAPGVRSGFYVGLLCYGWFYWDGAEHTGARASPALRRSWPWFALHALVRHRVIAAASLAAGALPLWESGAQALYVAHPHGMVALGAVLSVVAPASYARANVLIGVHWLLLALPLVRDAALACGCVSRERSVLLALLAKGHSVALIPEGTRAYAPHLFTTAPRDGFIALAHEARVPLVLLETPGEAGTYTLWSDRPLLARRLDGFRARSVARWHYPFPTLFSLWLPRKPVRTYAWAVEAPRKKETPEAYGERVREQRAALREVAQAAHELTT